MNKQEYLPQSEAPVETTEFRPDDEIWTRKADERLVPYDAVPHTPLQEAQRETPEQLPPQQEAGIITMYIMHMRRNEQLNQNMSPQATNYNKFEPLP